MNTSKLWSALVLSCIACGSSFRSNDASTGGDGSGGTNASSGGDISSGGTTSSGGHGGGTSSGGHGHGGGVSVGGSVSAGGVIGVGGSVNIGGDVGIAGGSSGGGVVGVSGSTSSGGSAGSNSVGGSGGAAAGAGGSTSVDCSSTGPLWKSYMDLVSKASLCQIDVIGQCVSDSNIVTMGNCPIPVNAKDSHYSAAKNALQNWKNAGCIFKPTMCLAQGTPACELAANSSYVCASTPPNVPN